MARTTATLPAGSRITDYISLGVIARWFPRHTVERVLRDCGRASRRQRDLPAPVMVYYVIALALYMHSSYREVLRCLLEGLQWLHDPASPLKVAGDSGISQARSRLGVEPVEQLHDELVRPLATNKTRGSFYRQWQLVSLDGSTLDVADQAANRTAFGYPGASRGASAFPQLRFVSLLDNGTHVLFGSRMGPCATGEITLAQQVLPALAKGMLCLADRKLPRLPAVAASESDGRATAVGGPRSVPVWTCSSASPTAPTAARSTPRQPTGANTASHSRCASSSISSRASTTPRSSIDW